MDFVPIISKIPFQFCGFSSYLKGMSRKYKFHNPGGVYFISFSTVKWVKIFNEERYLKILDQVQKLGRKV